MSAKCAKVQVIYQVHPSILDNDEVGLRQTCQSQFRIAQLLWDKADAIVFVEGLDQDYGPSDLATFRKRCLNFKDVLRAFGSGLPRRFRDLTDVQREILSKNSAAIILYILGCISEIKAPTPSHFGLRALDYASLAEKRFGDILFSLLSGTFLGKRARYIIFHSRDKKTAQTIKNFIDSDTEKARNIFVIFGGAHKTHWWLKKFGLKSRVIRTDWEHYIRRPLWLIAWLIIRYREYLARSNFLKIQTTIRRLSEHSKEGADAILQELGAKNLDDLYWRVPCTPYSKVQEIPPMRNTKTIKSYENFSKR